MKNQLLIVFAFILWQHSAAQSFTLKGELRDFKPVKMVYFFYRTSAEKMKDSTGLTNNKFIFKGNVTEPTQALMQVNYKDPDHKPQKMTFYIEPGTMKLLATGDAANFTLSGSDSHKSYEIMSDMLKPVSTVVDSLQQVYQAARRTGSKEEMKKLQEQLVNLGKEQAEIYGVFVKRYPNSPLALYALQQYAGFDIDPVKVEPLFGMLPDEVKSRPAAIDLKKLIEAAKLTAIGQPAIEFTQPDTSGVEVSLSSFKGKYVLLDFWASWCAPCRAENPAVVKVFNNYKDKNFTILGVSLDGAGTRSKWLDAIHKDGLTWTHVSDLKFWNNAAARLYGVKAIPQNFLIDPKGKIVGRNLRGAELGKKLAELLRE